MRPDLRPRDLLLLITMVEGVVAEEPAAADLSIQIALDGIFSDCCGQTGRAEGTAVVGHHG